MCEMSDFLGKLPQSKTITFFNFFCSDPPTFCFGNGKLYVKKKSGVNALRENRIIRIER